MKMSSDYYVAFSFLLTVAFLNGVWGHGRLVDPPSRSSMWRFGFNTIPNYNDHELFCGGIDVQWKQNKGRCGVCGDPYNEPQPRDNEAGGKYGLGIIVETYKSGQVLKAVVDLTANHKGYFEFRICPNNNPKKVVSERCLNKYVLPLAHSNKTRYYVKDRYIGLINVQLKLPEGLTCSQCVFQWQYRGENNWGTCADGSQHLGCGPQETFRACADVAIVGDAPPEHEVISNEEGTTSTEEEANRNEEEESDSLVLPNEASTVPGSQVQYANNCEAVESLQSMPGFNVWCQNNCEMGNCPPNMCLCRHIKKYP